MTDYKPGTVAKATVRGQRDALVMRARNGTGAFWFTPERECGDRYHSDRDVTDVRPLVVLDIDESVGKSSLPTWLRNNAARLEWECVSPSSFFKDVNWLADQIEAQTRPAEPTEGTLAKVTANTLKSASVIFAEWARGMWRHANGEPVNFGSGGVRVVEIVREGVQP